MHDLITYILAGCLLGFIAHGLGESVGEEGLFKIRIPQVKREPNERLYLDPAFVEGILIGGIIGFLSHTIGIGLGEMATSIWIIIGPLWLPIGSISSGLGAGTISVIKKWKNNINTDPLQKKLNSKTNTSTPAPVKLVLKSFSFTILLVLISGVIVYSPYYYIINVTKAKRVTFIQS